MKINIYSFIFPMVLTFCLSFIPAGSAMERSVHLYLDADLSHAVSSSKSIEQGILTALSEKNYELDGYRVKLILLDHRGNSRRSLDNIKTFLEDERALAVFGGLHSPPLLSNLKFINEYKVLHLIPWAAAGPITRFSHGTNWVFRLSIDDSKAGEVLVKHAVEVRHKLKPALLLEETGWGRSNEKTMEAALASRSITHAGIFWFKWGTKENSARIILRKIFRAGADSILLVVNAPEGKRFARAMASFPKEERLPFFSHWGITGGDFPKIVHGALRKKIDLSFLQTSFSFISNPDHPLGQKVLEKAKEIFPDTIQSNGDITAPTGFIHAYDLTKILIAAVQQTGLTNDIKEDRNKIRNALENLHTPVQGLIKTYVKPFSIFDKDHPDAHEALSSKDFTLGQYDENNNIILIQKN